MSTIPFDTHATVFRDLILLENISDRDFELLTLAEDCILDHTPTTSAEARVMVDVIKQRYGEPQDRPLHQAMTAIVGLIDTREGQAEHRAA